MLNSAESYKNAIKLTGNKTLPEPTVAFDISKYWNIKRNSASIYKSQEESMKKISSYQKLQTQQTIIKHLTENIILK